MPWSPHFAPLTQRFHFMSIRFRRTSSTGDRSDSFIISFSMSVSHLYLYCEFVKAFLLCLSRFRNFAVSFSLSFSTCLNFSFNYFCVRILSIVIDLFFPSVHSHFIHTTTFFFVEGMSPVGSSLHHQPSQITCHNTSLADSLLRDQIAVPITGQILADTLSLSHHLSHFHSVLSTQTTSPL